MKFGLKSKLIYNPSMKKLLKKAFLLATILFVTILNNTANALEESLQEACDNKNMKACSMLALFYIEDDGPLDKDLSKAVKLFKKACNGNWVSACHNIGYMYHQGSGVEKDLYKAKSYYQKACSEGNPESCGYLAVFYGQGYAGEKDDFKAAEFAEKSCNADSGWGCNILGFFYNEGRGVRKNLCSALEFYGKACDNKFSTGCSNYARMVDETKGDC